MKSRVALPYFNSLQVHSLNKALQPLNHLRHIQLVSRISSRISETLSLISFVRTCLPTTISSQFVPRLNSQESSLYPSFTQYKCLALFNSQASPTPFLTFPISSLGSLHHGPKTKLAVGPRRSTRLASKPATIYFPVSTRKSIKKATAAQNKARAKKAVATKARKIKERTDRLAARKKAEA